MTTSETPGNKLSGPPRTVPAGLAVYLLLLATQLGWLFLSVGTLLFWFNCAFGADVKALLFLAPPRVTSGMVTGFEVTPIVESAGSTSSAGGVHHDYNTHRVFAVHYTYVLSNGRTEHGTSYEGALADDGPMVRTPQSAALLRGGGDVPVELGMTVPVEYVRGLPKVSRIQGMRSNVYPFFMLGVLVFTVVGVVLLRLAFKNYRRIQFLLRLGVEDAAHKSLEDPMGHLLSLPLEDPSPRWFGIRNGQLHAPGLPAWLKVLIIPAGSLFINILYFLREWGQTLYTWHSLTGH